ncbi:fatty acid desaturase [Motilibacter rhizosphaerae]|uniref:Fatty acid desaturase n=1 Tax=Motilibacter rhizosphaerae TaxID=598652 RepID=A0A4Q7NVK3_9ACTN|nr:acyl-CoA desaturase [Motilibacter rhizosphaerae]RZS91000.1 fatty acid desaturase [Motilibacter rhizosphaerae]
MTPSTPAAAEPATRPAPQRPRERAVSDYAELSRRIQEAGLLRRAHAYYWSRIAFYGVAFAGAWATLVLVGDSWWQLLVAVWVSLVVVQVTFLGHDAAHRQVFASHAWNEWSARIFAGGIAGLSYRWWTSKHNRHHSGPNQVGRDPDIESAVLAFTLESAAERHGLRAWFARRQGWAFFPLLLLEGVNLHAQGVIELVGKRGAQAPHRVVELALLVTRLAANLAVVVLVLPPGKAAAFLAVQLGLTGLLLGGSFAPNHKGMPVVPREMRVDFLRRQVLMSRNVRGGRLVDWAMGGLNYQVEHHLFPSMPRPHLRRAKPLVEAFCAERGVTYTETGLFESYGIVVRYLNAVGLRARDPFTCPLVSVYRG